MFGADQPSPAIARNLLKNPKNASTGSCKNGKNSNDLDRFSVRSFDKLRTDSETSKDERRVFQQNFVRLIHPQRTYFGLTL